MPSTAVTIVADCLDAEPAGVELSDAAIDALAALLIDAVQTTEGFH